MPSFSLADLIPEPLTYIDDVFGGDGQRHDMRTTDAFSPEDLAVYLRFQREATAAYTRLEQLRSKGAKADLDQIDKLTAQIVRILDDQLLHLMPTMSRERLAQYTTKAKLAIVSHWQQQQPRVDAGEARPRSSGAKTPRGRRSPASVASTAERRSTT